MGLFQLSTIANISTHVRHESLLGLWLQQWQIPQTASKNTLISTMTRKCFGLYKNVKLEVFQKDPDKQGKTVSCSAKSNFSL